VTTQNFWPDDGRLDDPFEIDTSVAHPARRYNYWLGGTDNFEADRASGDAGEAAFPAVRIAAVENRRFLHRAVTFLVKEAGIRQFLDIGTGIPSAGNVHEVAQAIAPETHVVYADNDPLVLAHARRLLSSTAEGRHRLYPRRSAHARPDSRASGSAKHPRSEPARRADAGRGRAILGRCGRPPRTRGDAGRGTRAGQLSGDVAWHPRFLAGRTQGQDDGLDRAGTLRQSISHARS
jgi:hypothetical protein